MEGMSGGFLFVCFAILYFVPLLVARGKENKSAANGVAVLNVLLGWTVLGWIGALIWAVTLKSAKAKPIPKRQRVPAVATLATVVFAALTLGNTGCDPDNVAIGDELITIDQGYNSNLKLNNHDAIHRLDLNVQLLARLAERQAERITVLETLIDRIADLETVADQFQDYAALAQTVEDNQWTIDSTYAGYSLLMRCLQLGTWSTDCRDDAGLYPTHFDPTL